MTIPPQTRNFAGDNIYITMTSKNKQPTPRWVKISGLLTLLLLLAIIIRHLSEHNFHHHQ